MEERLMDTLEARRADTPSQDHLARARALRPLIAGAADEAERRRELTPEVVDALIENGIFRMLLPKSLGGAELDPLTYTAVLEELAQGDGSTAWCLGQNSGCSMIAPYLPADSAEEVFGGPRGILAWGPDLPGAGRTVAVGGGFGVRARSGAVLAWRAVGAFPQAAATPAGSAAMCPFSNRTARRDCCRMAGSRSARWCSANPRRRSSTIGTCSGCAPQAATATRSKTISCRSALARAAITSMNYERRGPSTNSPRA